MSDEQKSDGIGEINRFLQEAKEKGIVEMGDIRRLPEAPLSPVDAQPSDEPISTLDERLAKEEAIKGMLETLATQLDTAFLEKETKVANAKNQIITVIGKNYARYVMLTQSIAEEEKKWEKTREQLRAQMAPYLIELKSHLYSGSFKVEYQPGSISLDESKVLVLLHQLKATDEQIKACYSPGKPYIKVVPMKGK